jgi:hypothetical protein
LRRRRTCGTRLRYHHHHHRLPTRGS